MSEQIQTTSATCVHNNPVCGRIVAKDKANTNYIYVEHKGRRFEFCSFACLSLLIKANRKKSKDNPNANIKDTLCDLCSSPIPAGESVHTIMLRGEEFDNCCGLCAKSYDQGFQESAPGIAKDAPKIENLDKIVKEGFRKVLEQAVSIKSSDIFISVGNPVRLRTATGFKVITEQKLTNEMVDKAIEDLLPEKKLAEFRKGNDVDMGFGIDDLCRFRVNLFHEKDGAAMVIRPLPFDIPDLASLNLPDVLNDFSYLRSGLILVTGVTGSGKSTTLASFVNTINRRDERHIITIEDPIEYVLPGDQKSLVHQREVGTHTASFSDGLRSALRENPDVIVVGELRDLESITLALRAAETGHLVVGTLHSGTAVQAITRIVDVFDATRHAQIRVQLAQSLQGILSQRLLPLEDGSGRIAATEVLVANMAIRNIIRDNRVHEIQGYLITGKAQKMHTMEQSVKELIQQGLVDSSVLRELNFD